MNIILLLLTLLGAVASCLAYKDGAPVSVCDTLMPNHGATPNLGTSPYIVSAEKIEAKKVKVKISSSTGEKFKGFMLQARSANDKDEFIAGEFKNDAESKGISCSGHEKSALTHVNNNDKSEVITEWTGTADKDVIFRATVVQSKTVFWTDIDSEPVAFEGEEPGDDEVTNTKKKTKESVYHDCFKSKGCLGMPNYCVNNSNCDVLLTYQGNNDDESVQFALYGRLNDSEYMAVGLSDDKEMGDDTVTGCLRVGSNVKLQKSWNVPEKYNTIPTDVSEPHEADIIDGLTTCIWKEPKTMTFNSRSYDFANDKIYILLAVGPVKSDKISYHRTTLSTRGPVDFFGHEWVGYIVRESKRDQNKASEEPPKKRPEKGDNGCSSCSQLNFGLLWIAFFAVFYAGGRNVLNFV